MLYGHPTVRRYARPRCHRNGSASNLFVTWGLVRYEVGVDFGTIVSTGAQSAVYTAPTAPQPYIWVEIVVTLDYGSQFTVDVSGGGVTRKNGPSFDTSWKGGLPITINGVQYNLFQVVDATHLSLQQDAGTQSNASLIAPQSYTNGLMH